MPTALEFNEFFPLLTVGAAAISVTGLTPRIGPGRAIWIALRSSFAFRRGPESVRASEITFIRRILAKTNISQFSQAYLVVTGEKGVGKTCLVNTAIRNTPGVITVKAPPGQSGESTICNALRELTGIRLSLLSVSDSAKRVIFWHRIFTLGRSPIVVINATDRNAGQEYASLTGAVRTLVDDYKLRVIVDSSPNALDASLLRTTRELVMDIKPMTKDMIWQLEQFQDLFKYVKEACLEDVVFAVLGGIPSYYETLWLQAENDLQNGQNPRKVIGTYLRSVIASAIRTVMDSQSKANDLKEIMKLFDKEKMCIRSHTLTERELVRPTPVKVFRQVERDNSFILVPATNAICIVLQHDLTTTPTLDKLEEMLKSKS